MAFETIKFADIAFSHLQELVENGVSESRTLEYKSAMYERNDSGRKEAVKDLTAFANSDGGHLIIGIAEKNGALEFSAGIDSAMADKEIQWLENLLRDSVEPRLIGQQIKSVPLPGDRAALVIHIPRSWTEPHRTNSKHYYIRNSNGVHEASVGELRALFLTSQSETDRIRRFVEDRIGALATGDGIMPLSATNLVALHIVPVLSFLGNEGTNVRRIMDNIEPFHLISGEATASQSNLDGVCRYLYGASPINAYTQIFRNWSIEAVWSKDFVSYQQGANRLITAYLPNGIVNAIGQYEKALFGNGVQYPLAVFISLIGFKGTKFRFNQYRDPRSERAELPISQHIFTLPESILDKPPDSEARGPLRLKGTLDALWNAAGKIECPWFDGNGNWNPPR